MKLKPWNKNMRARAPSTLYNKFTDHDGNELDAAKYIQMIAYGENFTPRIEHGNLLFINPQFDINKIKDDDIILDSDHILWYVDKTNKRFYRTDNREMEYDESKIKGIVEYRYNVNDKKEVDLVDLTTINCFIIFFNCCVYKCSYINNM